jgi:hypothetical protein
MNASINGFYAAYLTGSAGQGFAMLVFRDGTIVGVDATGVKFDGTYGFIGGGFPVKLKVSIPPNTLLIQGVTSGPQNDNSELEFQLPVDFLSQPFIRISAKHGPLNVKLVKLREFDD